jgi:SAM-dependent methyltransferase
MRLPTNTGIRNCSLFAISWKVFSLFRLTGKLEGRTVLDLACGEGHYTRRIKQAGAARVFGVDISPEMIKLAEESEEKGPLGCQYSVGNAANLSLGERFDFVVGVYLLNYASSRAILLDLCRTIYDHLKPGGVFVGINASMTLDPAKHSNYQKYGLMLLTPDNRVEGGSDHLCDHVSPACQLWSRRMAWAKWVPSHVWPRAYAEWVPVVCIVGTPPLQAIEEHALLHHTLFRARASAASSRPLKCRWCSRWSEGAFGCVFSPAMRSRSKH